MKPTEQGFTTFDIVNKLGIKRERLKDWLSRGYIEPSIQKAAGQGTKNLFSKWDLYEISLFQYLIARGFSRKDASIRIRNFHNERNTNDEKRRMRFENADYVAIGGSLNLEMYASMGIKKPMPTTKIAAFLDLNDVHLPGKFLDCIDILIIDLGSIKKKVDAAIL